MGMLKKWNRKLLLLYIICFFAARFEGVAGLQPFVMALFAGLYLEPRLPKRLGFAVLLAGLATAAAPDMLVRYGMTMLTLLFVAGLAEGVWIWNPQLSADRAGRKRLSLVKLAFLNGIVAALVRLGGGMLFYESGWATALLEGVYTVGMTIVLQKGIHFLLYPSAREEMDGKELISLAVLVLGAVCGLPQFPNGFSLVHPGAVLALLYLGYSYGIGTGTVAGALAGLVMGIQTGDLELVGCYAIFGMVSCAMRELGKVPVALTYLMLSASAGFAWKDFFLTQEGLLGTLPALILFLLLPGGKERRQDLAEEPMVTTMQAVTKAKLTDISEAFRKLSELMACPAEPRKNLGGGELNRIFNLVSESCCAGCEKKNVCMKTEFYDTYHNVFQILNRAEQNGQIRLADVPEEFMERCIRPDYFLMEAGRNLELARTNLAWQNRMAENRVVVAEQFAGVAGMMEDVVQELGNPGQKRGGEENDVRKAAESAGMEVCQAAVKEREDGRKEIYLTARMAEGGCMTTRDLAELLGQVTGRKYHASFATKTVVNGEWATLTFLEDTAFRFYSGVAGETREGEPCSGDCHSVMELPQGEAVLLLSDGMGSGTQAARESTRMVELLEQFLSAGLESMAAMKLIRSSIFLRENEGGTGESFATVDLFRIDLCTGIARYIKIGAADSFLVRGSAGAGQEGVLVERLSHSSLPAGILMLEEEPEQMVKLYEGDFLVMATDGFFDCFEDGQVEEVLRSVIGGRRQNNAGELARILMDAAMIHCGGMPGDDVTVIVTGVWE